MEIYEALYMTRAMWRLKPDPIPYDVQARMLDAAIRASTIGERRRFLLVDDAESTSQLAPLYRTAFECMIGGQLGDALSDLLKAATPMGRTARSAVHLAHHYCRRPVSADWIRSHARGQRDLPGLWSAMLAAREPLWSK